MAYADQHDCPNCGFRYYRESKETWKKDLAQFLAFFCNMITPSETARLIRAGLHLGMWGNRMTAYRRLAQIEIEGYITQPCYAWWVLTEKGIIAGQQYLLTHPEQGIVEGVNDPISIPGPTVASHPDRLEGIPTPTDWQLIFLREYAKLPAHQLYGFDAVARWAKKEGLLGLTRRGTTAIRVLIGDGWLIWGGPGSNYLILPERSKRLLDLETTLASDLPSVDRTPGVDDQTPP